MRSKKNGGVVAAVMAAALLGWVSNPAAAERIEVLLFGYEPNAGATPMAVPSSAVEMPGSTSIVVQAAARRRTRRCSGLPRRWVDAWGRQKH